MLQLMESIANHTDGSVVQNTRDTSTQSTPRRPYSTLWTIIRPSIMPYLDAAKHEWLQQGVQLRYDLISLLLSHQSLIAAVFADLAEVKP
eukprot:scaffold263280_cov50-Prasinocladus_malaysianus.AAC.1